MEGWKIRLQWFKDRIGKRIYRDSVNCKCEVCNNVGAHGLIIIDESHAHYLFDCEEEPGIRYRDNPELLED